MNTALGELRNDIVFVGGATVSLYADRMAEEIRPTDDVDILVELWSVRDYAAFEEKLRHLGFTNDTTAKFAGRYIIEGVIVDLMPISEDILGFSNIWYAGGFRAAIEKEIDEFHTVKIFPAPYFIAAKLEAFKNRGKADGRTSTDFEDIVYVLENTNSIWEEMKSTNKPLNKYLKEAFSQLLANQYLEEWIDAHTGYNSPSSAGFILDNLQVFCMGE